MLLTPWKPRTYLIIFVTCDIFNLILQGLGGGISSTQQHPKGIQAGINIVIAGLVSQVVSLSIFMICCAHFAFRVFRSVEKPVQIFSHIRDTKRFQSFLIGELFLLISLASPITDNGLPSRYRLGHNLHLHAFQLQNSRAQTRVHWTSCQQRSSFHGMYFSSNFLMPHLISVDSGRWHDLNRNDFSDLAAPRPLLSRCLADSCCHVRNTARNWRWGGPHERKFEAAKCDDS